MTDYPTAGLIRRVQNDNNNLNTALMNSRVSNVENAMTVGSGVAIATGAGITYYLLSKINDNKEQMSKLLTQLTKVIQKINNLDLNQMNIQITNNTNHIANMQQQIMNILNDVENLNNRITSLEECYNNVLLYQDTLTNKINEIITCINDKNDCNIDPLNGNTSDTSNCSNTSRNRTMHQIRIYNNTSNANENNDNLHVSDGEDV